MSDSLIKEAKKVLAGKGGRLQDEELEYLAQEITKLGFKLGYARAYASGPSIMKEMIRELEQQHEQLNQIRKILGCK
jgi:molybdopterin-biosynthesis enzyme MoeA-like protein